jgi:Undecaprenyl-phosphate galactose phosphotransferase WbaP
MSATAAAAARTLEIPQIPQRSWATPAIVLIDVVALEVSLLLACLVRYFLHSLFPIGLEAPQYLGLAVGVLTLPLAYYWVGLYPGYGMGAVQRIRGRVYATFTVFCVLLIWNYSFHDHQWSRGVLVFTMFFALILAPALESPLRKAMIVRGICGVPVVILGAGTTGTSVVKALRKERDLGFVPIAFLDDDPQKWGSEICGVSVLGPLASVGAFEGRAKVALVAMPRIGGELLSNLVQSLSFASIIVIPDLFGIQSLWITSRDLGGVLGLEVKKNLLVASNRMLKRLLDYAVALPIAIVSAPFIFLCALWIKSISPGSAFFRQEREGKGGKRITVLKLRTMYPNSESLLEEHLNNHPEEKLMWLRHYKLKTDPRVLPGIGRFLRRYSLDELPQLWNVLRGDMSLVGPRPFPYYHLDTFSPAFRLLRSSVMPGVTGLWQVSARSDGDTRVQQVEDTYYIRNWSLWLDVYLLLRTVHSVVAPKGAY